MKSIGSILFIYGLLAIIMNFFNAVPRLLLWIYNWGEGTAWGIKIVFVVVGAVLWIMGNKNKEKELLPAEEPNNDQKNTNIILTSKSSEQ
ncbi:hypothetical protein [Sphingobacterium daejeonense]|uniref:hypothetical protein n=1 Tax=Sphingobacterium daejeonense TaxID=371142 RepID=UPI0010C4703F|nr:hypothetical protein [Sphingobacterium daejeonense]VTP94705.1 Uncharacterised protein [Sphingobacterium daejeonense]